MRRLEAEAVAVEALHADDLRYGDTVIAVDDSGHELKAMLLRINGKRAEVWPLEQTTVVRPTRWVNTNSLRRS